MILFCFVHQNHTLLLGYTKYVLQSNNRVWAGIRLSNTVTNSVRIDPPVICITRFLVVAVYNSRCVSDVGQTLASNTEMFFFIFVIIPVNNWLLYNSPCNIASSLKCPRVAVVCKQTGWRYETPIVVFILVWRCEVGACTYQMFKKTITWQNTEDYMTH